MKNKNTMLKVICVSISLTFFTFSILGVTALLTGLFNATALILTILSICIFLFFWWLGWLINKNYKLKYYFLGKNFKKQIKNSLFKFGSNNQVFIKNFINTRKIIYRETGKIFYDDTNPYLYRDNKILSKILELYELLLNSIKTKGGFVEFCRSIDLNKYDSGWQIANYMSGNLISHELQYLINEVFLLTDFIVSDNGLSEKYTELNNMNIKVLNEVMSPMLFNFDNELCIAIQKLKLAIERENKEISQ